LTDKLFSDVAVLKLSAASTVTPIALNSDTSFPSTAGTPMTVIGFGVTSEGGQASSVLKKLGTFFVPISTCQTKYPDVRSDFHVCGDVTNAGDCQGDSGGPLFATSSAGIVQTGVVSYGIGCARSSEVRLHRLHSFFSVPIDFTYQSIINNSHCYIGNSFCFFGF